MRAIALTTMLAVPLALSACDSGADGSDAESPPMASDSGMRMARAEGTVTAVDDAAGTITIDHGPVPAVDWPAMTMAFDADEELRRQVTVGDEIAFDFGMSDSGNRITSIDRK